MRRGYVEGLKEPLFTGRILLSWICFPALLFKPRARASYYLTAVLLFILAIVFVREAFQHRIPMWGDTSARILVWSFAGLMTLLFYRFSWFLDIFSGMKVRNG